MTDRTSNEARLLDAFRDILLKEQASGYSDKVVIGGLDRYLERNAGEIERALARPGAAARLRATNYAKKTTEARRDWVEKALPILDAASPAPSASSGPAPAEDPAPSPPPASAPGRRAVQPVVDAAAFRRPSAPRRAKAGGAPPSPSSSPIKGEDRPAPSISPSLKGGGKVRLPPEGESREGGPAQGQPAAPKPMRKPRPPLGPVDPDAPVTAMPGFNSVRVALLNKKGVQTWRGLLYYFPFRHEDYSTIAKVSQLVVGRLATIRVNVWEAHKERSGPKQWDTEATVGDETGNLRVLWRNSPWVAGQLSPGATIIISGKPDFRTGRPLFFNPEWELVETPASDRIHTGRLVPVYSETEQDTEHKKTRMSSHSLRALTHRALADCLPLLPDFLPASLRDRHNLLPLQEAIRQAHFPDSFASRDAAVRRLGFDEFLLIQLAVLSRKAEWRQDSQGIPIPRDQAMLKCFLNSLPFPLTEAQSRALDEVLKDMERGTPAMGRLLQGDVGSGKTVVALAALLVTAAAGRQGALMAPTEVLAEQHFATVRKLLRGMAAHEDEHVLQARVEGIERPLGVGLLLGRMTAKEKARVRDAMREGAIDIAIGTHALIQDDVSLPRLALAVVDEQHRFGVLQRAALRGKGGERPHVLAMSATPIPRTLALTLYGDLDISSIDQLPPGRQKVETHYIDPEKRQHAYGLVRREVKAGRQAFIICPLIEESEAVEARAAVDEYERLSKGVFPDLRLELLHGRMSSRDKEAAMRRFRDGAADVLVSTPVVEVGIDVPNATVMLIEGADRFGLSQLHQFRGRVGRGEHKSYCLLMSDAGSAEGKARLQALAETNDGFKLAELDLQMRGPGDFFGTRQSGLPDLRVARLGDMDLLREARAEAEAIIERDPDLSTPEHELLRREVARFKSRVAEPEETS